ncbi:MAG: hypothetical protein ABI672_05495 [Vicinamibacteria bacterium]
MSTMRIHRALLIITPLLLVLGCNRRGAVPANDITASFKANRMSAPLDSAIEVTYTWTTGPNFKKIEGDYRALVHFIDQGKVTLFTDDHAITPPPSQWEANKTYTYTRTLFIPVVTYIGDATVTMGLYPTAPRAERIPLKGEDFGLREYTVAKMTLLAQVENVRVYLKEGWHNPEPGPNPLVETTWTKKEAVLSFKNPKKPIILYLQFDAPYSPKNYPAGPPSLTVTAQGRAGFKHTFENGELVEKKIRFTAADLGTEDTVEVRFNTDTAIVPKSLGMSSTDDRELGVRVYDVFVGVEDELGTVPNVVDAIPMAVAPTASASMKPGAKATPAPKAAAKATPAPIKKK